MIKLTHKLKSLPVMERSGRTQELCESRGGRPGLPAPNNPHSLCGRDATLNTETIVIQTVVDHSVQSGASVLNPTWAAGTLTG